MLKKRHQKILTDMLSLPTAPSGIAVTAYSVLALQTALE